MKLVIHTDGGARGNPGPAAVGVVIQREGITGGHMTTVAEFGKTIGETTNNVAEYTAVVEAFQYLRIFKPMSRIAVHEQLWITFYLDSTLVANQLNGMFKVKDARLRELLTTVRIMEQEVGGEISYNVIPREKNRRADFMVNRALDTQK